MKAGMCILMAAWVAVAAGGEAAPPRDPASQRGNGVWWSLRPIVRPEVSAAGNAIDFFVRAALQGRGLEPSPAADRRTLLRRLAVDLTGLPPTPEEMEAFEKDVDPAAYEKQVDHLLASPRYGERWARHWLDTVHFADSHGFEHDVMRPSAWRYRDYVIASFNGDTPWPRFVREQLAADVLFPEQTTLIPALGFLGAGTYDMSAAATAPQNFEYLDRDDLVTQTMAAFASTTANCARCHEHKFDPISQDDYYSLQAVFAGIGKGEVLFDPDASVAAARRKWMSVAAAAASADRSVLLSPENKATVDAWEKARAALGPWQPLRPEVFVSAGGTVLERLDDDSLRAGGPRPDTDTYTVTANSGTRSLTALRLELMPDDSLPIRGPGRAENGNLHLTEIEVRLFRAGAAREDRVPVARVTSDFDQDGYGVAGSIDGELKSSWAIHPSEGQPHQAVFELASPVTLVEGDRLVIVLKQLQPGGHLLGHFRLSTIHSAAQPVIALSAAAEAALSQKEEARTDEQRALLAAAVLRAMAARELARLPAQEAVWAAARSAKNERGVVTLAEPRTIRVLARGELDKPGAEAKPGALSAVTALNARFDLADPKNEGLRRAALAEWLTAPEQPLMWRSIVNRVWHYHFGRGLCDTPSDFGRMGGIPSHPELVDWLAAWFRDDARGSLKALHRLIVTSETYRQSSAHREGPATLDPENRLLWRMNRTRLDADSIRDAIMAASGRLDLTLGGPGIQHFKTSPGPQATPVLNYDAFDWNSPGASRRSIYRVVWRGIPDPLMDALDFPDMGLLAPVRGFSASALQGLALFNNRLVLHHSTAFADSVPASLPVEERVTTLYRRALFRAPTGEESAAAAGLARLHGLAAVARVLFNSNEFLFVD